MDILSHLLGKLEAASESRKSSEMHKDVGKFDTQWLSTSSDVFVIKNRAAQASSELERG